MLDISVRLKQPYSWRQASDFQDSVVPAQGENSRCIAFISSKLTMFDDSDLIAPAFPGHLSEHVPRISFSYLLSWKPVLDSLL